MCGQIVARFGPGRGRSGEVGRGHRLPRWDKMTWFGSADVAERGLLSLSPSQVDIDIMI